MSDIVLEGTEELIDNLNKIDAAIRSEVAVKAVHAGALQIENRARINAPVLTGALRNSVSTKSKATGEGAEAEIGFRGLAYARIQEYGGVIRARNKPYLMFQVGGHFVKVKQVTIKGKHYFERAIESEKSSAVNAMGSVISSYLNK